MGPPKVRRGDLLADKYRVERVLGTGGMGVVVAATHVELGQRVALKFMLKEAMSDPAQAQRFAREARSAVQLRSAHTARVLDVGKLKNGEPFMVMEYLEGKDLDDVLKESGGQVAPKAAIDYILQACEGFAEAHSLGTIHRDIKLKNLFLTRGLDGKPLVKILDFGLAKQVGVASDVSLTATSAVFGSPQYMSPEQMRSAKDVDARSDIWSIGVCLYELLCGSVPFNATGLAELCAMVLKEAAPPLSTQVTGIPSELEAVVMQCLEKDPQKRFQTVAELAYALEPFAPFEGAAKRILQVMQSAEQHPPETLLNVASDDLGAAKTMSAWGPGERRGPGKQGIFAIGAASIALTIAVVAVGLVWRHAPTGLVAEPALIPSAAGTPPALAMPSEAATVPAAAPSEAASAEPPAPAPTASADPDRATKSKPPTKPPPIRPTARPTAAPSATRAVPPSTPTRRPADQYL